MPRLQDPRFSPDCAITLDGRRIPARTGEAVTSALLAAGRPLVGRSAKYHRPRGPFCLAASCATCLVRVDGVPNVRACETPCRDGLRVETQNALGGAAHDLLGAIDLLAPKGIDHHHVGTWSRVVNRVTVGASRQLAGLGQLPDGPTSAGDRVVEEEVELLVIGAGPAGLAAAAQGTRAGRRVLLCERERAVGGRLRCALDLPGDPPLGWAQGEVDAVRRAGGEVALRATVIGVWRDGGRSLAAVVDRTGPERVRVVRANRLVLATGTWAQPPLFEANDLPGVFAARGLLVALAEDGVVPGERAAVVGEGAEAEAVAARLAAAGMQVEHVRAPIVRGRGRGHLSELVLGTGAVVRCDALAAATPRMPASELAREAGAALVLDEQTGAYRVAVDEGGRVRPGVFAAGEVTGPCSAAQAAEAGRRAGEEAARE